MNTTRRAFLAAAGASATVAAAGCLGSDDEPVEEGDRITLEGEDVLPVPVAGDPDADVTVTVFEDFGCGACRTYKTTVYPDVRESYVDPGEIRYEHRDFPVGADPDWSWEIAGAARSVQQRADDEAFWAFAERIYEHQGQYSNEAIVDVVEEVNGDGEYDIDPEAVVDDVEGETYREDLEAEFDRAREAGVERTPTVVVDGAPVSDWSEYETVRDAIESAL